MTEAERNRLVIEHMDDLVPATAAEFRGGEMEWEELLAYGRLGLVKASRDWDERSTKFSTYAIARVRTEIQNAIRTAKNEKNWSPHDEYAPVSTGDHKERIYDYDAWGEFGNAIAISEMWSKLDSSPEELLCSYEDIKDQKAKFRAAFMSLTKTQQKLVTLVYLTERMTIDGAARELKISYHQAIRLLKKALRTMRDVLTAMETV